MYRDRGAPWGPGGHIKPPPLWSLTNIKHVAANITRGAADILRGAANILRSAVNILHSAHLLAQDSFLDFFKGKNTHGVVLRLTGFEKCPRWFFNGNSAHYNIVL